MTKQPNQQPKLRFPQFNDNWTAKKLGEVAEINPSGGKIPQRFIYIDLESVLSGVLLKENYLNKEDAPSRAQRCLLINDILFQTVRPYQMNNLFFDKKGDYVASTGYAQIRTKQYAKYLYQYFHTSPFVTEVIQKCTGTSYPAINSGDLANIQISLPSLPEQNKIADFLSTVDKKLNLLSQEIALSQSYKKGLMQALFSQTLRFKDDQGQDFPDWEEKRLGEVAVIKKGQQLNKSELTESGSYPCLNGGIIPSGFTEQFNTEANTITISEGGNSCGFVSFMKTKFWLGGHCYKILVQDGYNLNYFYQVLKFYEPEIMKLRVGSGLPNIQQKNLRDFLIHLTKSLPEQAKIAGILSAWDEKIANLQAQEAALRDWKRGLLQEMFV